MIIALQNQQQQDLSIISKKKSNKGLKGFDKKPGIAGPENPKKRVSNASEVIFRLTSNRFWTYSDSMSK